MRDLNVSWRREKDSYKGEAGQSWVWTWWSGVPEVEGKGTLWRESEGREFLLAKSEGDLEDCCRWKVVDSCRLLELVARVLQ